MKRTALKLSEFLPFRLSLASNLISSRIAETYEAEFRLSMTQWRVMAVLGEHPGLTATELTRKTALDKVAISRAVAALVERGLVKREAEQDDGRRSSLALTQEGLAIYREIIPRAVALEKALLESLDDRTRRALEEALAALTEKARSL